MSLIWPLDVKNALQAAPSEDIRPFKCLLLMPFEDRFNTVADLLRQVVEFVNDKFRMPLPQIERLDWVTSSNVIQQEIWQKVLEADLVFCDITGLNPNVMFELGVSAAWKDITRVILLKERSAEQGPAFDIAPIRYTDYDLTYPAVDLFRDKVRRLVEAALISYPDGLGAAAKISYPLAIEFSSGRDDPRIYTPPFAHRRVIDGALEFGSIFSYPDSWASLGKERILNFKLNFRAKFSHPSGEAPKIGLAVRSQHYFANYGHNISLMGDGSIWITKPSEEPPNFYEDERVRDATPIDHGAFVDFSVEFTEELYRFSIGAFSHTMQVRDMKKQFGAGLIRFHAARSWMAISSINLELQGSR